MGWIFGELTWTELLEASLFNKCIEPLRVRDANSAERSFISNGGRIRAAASVESAASNLDIGADIVVMLDGHITNHADLARELGYTTTNPASYATVIVEAYQKWGVDLFSRLHGEFAIALWDEAQATLLLGRDRIGVKPLYYHVAQDRVVFASLPSALLRHPSCPRTVAIQSLPLLFQPRLMISGEVPLDGVNEVPAAHVVRFSKAGIRLDRYWQLGGSLHTKDTGDAGTRVRELLEHSVRVRGRDCDAAMLSGGLDSTSVAALAQSDRLTRGKGPLQTFCIAFENDRTDFASSELRPDLDAPYALSAATELGTRHRTLTLGIRDLTDVVQATRDARGLPGWGQFDASMYNLFKAMSSDASQGLTGEAADELFGGYPYFFDKQLLTRQTFPWIGDSEKLTDFLTPEIKKEASPEEFERDRYQQLVHSTPHADDESPYEARIREALFLGIAGPLSVVLERKERMSTAAGIDIRMPFCDHLLMEYVWNVPWSIKSKGGTKGLLKSAMQDILPQATLNRRKSAYPHIQSSTHDKYLIENSQDLISNPNSRLGGLFDKENFKDFLNRVSAGQIGSRIPGGASPAGILIQLLETEQWMNNYSIHIR